MRALYLAERGHVTACGAGLQAARTVLAGQPQVQRWQVAGEEFPFFGLAMHGAWPQRAQAALAACAQALAQPAAPDSLYAFASSSFQGGWLEEHLEALARDGQTMPPLSALDDSLNSMGHFAAAACSALGGASQPWCFSTACTSAITALHAAMTLMQTDACNEATIVSVELRNRLSASGFHSLGLLSRTRPQPFAAARDGLVLGEAVAALRLSTQRPAVSPTCWRLAACELGLDAHSLTGVNPDGSVAAHVMRQALQQAGLAPADIALVKVHAAGVSGADLAEARALHSVFGPAMPPLVSLKPWIGHTQGASGLAELALLLDCLELGSAPGQPYATVADPEIALHLESQPKAMAPRCVMLLSIGFGGSIGVVLLTREDA